MKHTPGPWHNRRVPEFPNLTEIVAEDGTDIIYTGSFGLSSETEQANASLIAAAPELLEALEAMISATSDIEGYHGVLGPTECLAVNAIAKAKGQASSKLKRKD